MKQTLEFTAIDTLFFRESRPMEAPGSSELNSLFPPPMRTVAGAVRTYIGEREGVDWRKFRDEDEHPLRKKIGYGNDFADLQFQGVWVHYQGNRLYPAPLNLMVKRENLKNRDEITAMALLTVGPPRACDLGQRVRLPCLPEPGEAAKDMSGAKPLQDCWMTSSGLQKILSGDVENIDWEREIIKRAQLLEAEHRLGIARDNPKRVAAEGMLYQTCHLRFNHETRICVDLSGLNNSLEPGIVRLGGEGRMAGLQPAAKPPSFPQAPVFNASNSALCKGIILYLLSPMLLPENAWFLPGFTKVETEEKIFWKGKLHGIDLNLISSVTGKAQREGGWDMATHAPRAVQSMVPAGSVFYCEVENGDHGAAITALHNQQIGEDLHLGRGHIAVGLWLEKIKKG